LAEGRRGDAVAYFMTQAAGVPAEFVDQMQHDPTWPAFEAVAHTLPYDCAIVGDTGSGDPRSLTRWASVTVPTLVMDGGASAPHMHHAAQVLADVLPHAQRRTLEGQMHDVAPELLAPILEAFFKN
ncbi:MAG TPA: alpha/beta hydrolase, partial [Ktedonobacterales bacterium]